MHESERLITATPAQNLDTGNVEAIQRLIPLLVAETMTRLTEHKTGTPMPRIDMWNCVGFRMDLQFSELKEKEITRQEHTLALLARKYKLLQELGIGVDSRVIIRDDQEEVFDWLCEKLEKLLSEKRVYVDNANVQICDGCGYLQAVEGTFISECSKCHGASFRQETRPSLFVDLPKNRSSLYEGRIRVPQKQKQLRGMFMTLPPRMMISKTRDFGLSLDFIGLEDLVLDPKIGISLLPEMIAENYDLTEITQVQGIRAATNTVPYTSLLADGFSNTYVLLPRIPAMDIDKARDFGLAFVSSYLPLALMTRSRDLSETELERVRREYEKIIIKLNNCFSILKKEAEKESPLSQEDKERITRIANDFVNYDVQSGLRELRSFIYDVLSKKYTNEMKKENARLCQADFDRIFELVSLVYGLN